MPNGPLDQQSELRMTFNLTRKQIARATLIRRFCSTSRRARVRVVVALCIGRDHGHPLREGEVMNGQGLREGRASSLLPLWR